MSHLGRVSWTLEHCYQLFAGTFGDAEVVVTAADGDRVYGTFDGVMTNETTFGETPIVTGGPGRFAGASRAIEATGWFDPDGGYMEVTGVGSIVSDASDRASNHRSLSILGKRRLRRGSLSLLDRLEVGVARCERREVVMRKSMIVLALALTLVGGACGGDVTASDEYRALESEIAALDRQLSDAAAQLATASDEYRALESEIAALDRQLSDATAQLVEVHAGAPPEVPAEVLALLDEWWAANERKDGSVVDLYTGSGYHLYGQAKYSGAELAAHLQLAMSPEWITEPYLIVADESRGRYVVTRGMRSGPFPSAVTFEVVTTPQGELKLAQTAWTLVHQ